MGVPEPYCQPTVPDREVDGEIRHVAVAADGSLVAGAGWLNLFVWSRAGSLIKEARPYALHNGLGPLRSVALSPDARWLAVTRMLGDGARLLPVGDGAEQTLLSERRDGVAPRMFDVAFSRDGKFVAYGAADGRARIYDADDGLPVAHVYAGSGPARRLDFGPDGLLVVSGPEFGVGVWDWISGQALAKLESAKQDTTSVAFSPDGAQLIAAGPGIGVRLWDTQSFDLVRQWKPRAGAAVDSVAWGPDGATFVCSGRSGVVGLVTVDDVNTPDADPGAPSYFDVAWGRDTIALGTVGGVILSRPDAGIQSE